MSDQQAQSDSTVGAIPTPSDFALWTLDKVRYGDTDRQGHVNNATFATFFETGRVEFLYDDAHALPPAGCEFVIADLKLAFRAEIVWPGDVDIATRVGRIGRTSLQLEQGLFQGDRCVATAESTIVMIDCQTHRPTAFDSATRSHLGTLRMRP